MKKIILLLSLLGIYHSSVAQNTYPFPSSGNVGIGTTTPSNILHVNGASGLRLTDSPNLYSGNLVFGNNTSSWQSGIRTFDNSDAEMRIWHMNGRGQIILATGYNGDQATTLPNDGVFIAGESGVNRVGIGYTAADIRGGGGKLLINGNVGIGTTTPANILQVNGASGLRLTDGTNPYSGNLVFGTSATPWQSGIRTFDNSDAEMRIWHMNGRGQIILATGYNGDQATTLPNDGVFIAGESGVNRVGIGYTSADIRGGGGKLLINGNVGIGTTAPSEKLAVNGTIRAKEVKVEAAPWPDFVFEEGYELEKLEGLEKYIKVNKRLPKIPSAAEVEKQGISLGEMNAKLLQKIEELTLYMIELKKDNDLIRSEYKIQQKEIGKLKSKLDAL